MAQNGRLLSPEVADRLGDAGVAVFNFALDAWDLKPGLPKALVPAKGNLEYVLRKQYLYDYMVFFNINICRNNLEDVRLLTDFAHQRRVATDYHINETPMIQQDEHFKHLSENPTYIRPEDWRAVDKLIDWIIEKNKSGYQMVNSVKRLQEMKAFVRMGSGLNLQEYGWYGDGTSGTGEVTELLESMPGVVRRLDGTLQFEEMELPCRAEQRHHPDRRNGSAMLSHVRLDVRLGKHRPAEI